jgi:hypothetical protein
MLDKIFKSIIVVFAAIGFIMSLGFASIKFKWTDTSGMVDNQRKTFLKEPQKFPFQDLNETKLFKEVVLKDKTDLEKVEKETGVKARLIVSNLFVEQIRLYTTQRELFKNIFEPLKILGVQSQFSWGVMGIKQETAIEIEKNIKDKDSPFYLGKDFENILDFKTADHDTERFERLTDGKSRYYSYLYTALYIKEIEAQWKRNGFDISNNIGVLSTLFNIGFVHSIPNNNPQTGGAGIDINNVTYSFGTLADLFYYSDELIGVFPR